MMGLRLFEQTMQHQFRNSQNNYYAPKRQTPSPRHSFRRLLIPVAAMLVLGIVITSRVEAQVAVDAAAAKKLQAKNEVIQHASATIRSLIAADGDDTIGVAIENVKTGSITLYGQTSQFDAASTEKILSAITYYHLVEQGTLRLDDTVGPYPASYQLKQMINQSNNDSWDALNDAVGGNDALQAYAQSIGLHYNVDGNLMSAKDMATLLTKLYTGKLLNADDTKQLLSYMQYTNDETLIPSVLPSGLTIYHKYGELNDGTVNVLHDAGIVTDGSATYAIVIYSDGDSDETSRTDTIKQIAQAALTVCGW
jgi:beta-lactamase class A